tara:strand:- start:386 stop:622 length:237 start_codon:yes stop_codon:yes gene_type:complete
MKLEILTPEKEIFKGDIKSVTLPGTLGEFEILNQHAPIISTLTSGSIKIVTGKNEKNNFDINGGVVEMLNNKIIVLAN